MVYKFTNKAKKVIEIAKSLENIAKQLANTEPKKIIVVANRIVNIVL